MKEATYLIYIIAYELLCIAGPIYLIFWKNASGWWLVFGVVMSASAYSPATWIHGKEPLGSEQRDTEADL